MGEVYDTEVGLGRGVDAIQGSEGEVGSRWMNRA